MITHLRIKNVALIDETEVSFGEGLNVLTGETGAGKSIVVDSITFLLGGRPARDFLRGGAETAEVQGVIEIRSPMCLKSLEDAGVELEGNQLILERSLNAQGKSVCRINGRIVTVGTQKNISSLLIDIHGQHEHQSLLNPDKQLSMLDGFCGGALAEYKQSLDALLRRYRENGRAIKALSGFGGERETQLEIWRYQTDEIDRAKLKPGEEEALTVRRARLNGLEKLNKYTAEALALLTGGDAGENERPAYDMVNRAVSLLGEIGKLDASRSEMSGALNEAAVIINDAAAELRSYLNELDADPLELERVESRLDAIYRLKKKYGPSVEAVLSHRERTQEKIDKLLNGEAELKKLNADRRTAAKDIAELCGKMTVLRREHAENIQSRVAGVLKDLGMSHARFKIQLTQKKAFGPEGNDEAAFMISPNLGEPLKPLIRIASGGEMSRVMLALKTVMADFDGIETLIFDEVDAGVSGRTAQQVAEKLISVAKARQILCITHLPQIAAMADTHFLIEKTTEGERTVTTVKPQRRDETVRELARLTGGAEITQATLKAAADMKELAERLKAAAV